MSKSKVQTRKKPATKHQAYLVESIPTGMEELRETRGVDYTGPVLKRLTDRATKTIDLTAMYWALTPDPERRDERGFTVEDLLARFKAEEGQDLYDALVGAAARGVKIRIVESPGFDDAETESSKLEKAHPDRVEIRRIDMKDWYESGIMHQKIWIFDGRDVYLGSANNDWKSLTQVKEMGICVENDPAVAAETSRYFDAWWKLCGLEPGRKKVFDPASGIERTVPSWSELVPPKRRTANPLDEPKLRTRYGWDRPLSFGADAHMFLSGAPQEVCVGHRTFDGDALVNTLREAEESVSVCVMDFAPVSLYRGAWDRETGKYMVGDHVASPVWWPALFDAILYAATTRCLHVRLLVSKWAHSSAFLSPYLRALKTTADAATAKHSMQTGCLEVRRFVIPGWDNTEQRTESGSFGQKDASRQYPGHTRVNHTKYIVTDKRLNIGTSNMTWDYFVASAGASFNTDHRQLVAKLQEVFDRDWSSSYAVPLL